MPKKGRAAARKMKDKWKAKDWYNLIAPDMFNRALIGETLSSDPNGLVGRVSEVTVQDLTGDFSKMHIKLQFKIDHVKGMDAHTQFVGHDLTSDYVRRLTRRKKTRTDLSLDVVTKDGTVMKIKPMAIADRRIQSSKQSAIRAVMAKVARKAAKDRTIGEFVKTIISGELAKNLAISCKPIQPMQRIEIRKSEIVTFGELPEMPEEKPAEEPEEEKAAEEPEEEKPAEEAAPEVEEPEEGEKVEVEAEPEPEEEVAEEPEEPELEEEVAEEPEEPEKEPEVVPESEEK
jgi:small subunit ribosomal protein S3Ae